MSWKLLDPLTWEFELRQGVTFQDGEPFTADDVVFSLRRAASGVSQFKDYVRPIAAAEAVGDHAVRIRTLAPSPDLPTRLWTSSSCRSGGRNSTGHGDGAVR